MADLNVNNRINAVRKWANEQISVISSYENIVYRLILICSLIDAFAQNDSNYQTRDNAIHFAGFLEKYSKKYNNVIMEVCPITLFYNCFCDKKAELQLEKNRIFVAGDDELIQEANRLINLLPKNSKNKSKINIPMEGLSMPCVTNWCMK